MSQAALLHPPAVDHRPGRPLTDAERRDFERLQQIVECGREDVLAVAAALAEIRSRRLYLAGGYKTFTDYVERRWGYTKAWAYKLAVAGDVVRKQKAEHVPAAARATGIREALRIGEALDESENEVGDDDNAADDRPQKRHRGRASAGRAPTPRPIATSGAPDRFEIAAAISKQIEGHLRALELLHARHVCSGKATHTLRLLAATLLPWPPG